MDIQIIDAIKNKNLIEIYYENQLLIVEPYCYGITKAGSDYLIAFQVENCKKKETQDWKSFYLDYANDLNVLVKTFKSSRANLFSKAKMTRVYASI